MDRLHLSSAFRLYDRKTQRANMSASKTSQPEIERSAGLSAPTGNEVSVPQDVAEKIREMAKADAQKGIYMDEEYVKYINDYKQANISPNRSQLMSIVSPLLQASRPTIQPSFFQIVGTPFTGMLQVGERFGASLEVYDQNGDRILYYGHNSGWGSSPTKAEHNWHVKTRAIYLEAFRQAQSEMRTQGISDTSSDAVMKSSLDVSV